MTTISIHERLARVEERLEHVEAQHSIYMLKHKEVDDKLDTIIERFNAVTTELSRYKGFAGGCLFVLSAVWAFFKLVSSGFIHLGK